MGVVGRVKGEVEMIPGELKQHLPVAQLTDSDGTRQERCALRRPRFGLSDPPSPNNSKQANHRTVPDSRRLTSQHCDVAWTNTLQIFLPVVGIERASTQSLMRATQCGDVVTPGPTNARVRGPGDLAAS